MAVIGSVMCQRYARIFLSHGRSRQFSLVRPRSGKNCQNEPPAKSTISKMAKRKPGIA